MDPEANSKEMLKSLFSVLYQKPVTRPYSGVAHRHKTGHFASPREDLCKPSVLYEASGDGVLYYLIANARHLMPVN